MVLELPLGMDALRTLHLATAEAEALRLELVEPEQVFFGLTLFDNLARETLERLGDQYIPEIGRTYREIVEAGTVPSPGYMGRHIPRSDRTIKVLQKASEVAMRFTDRVNNNVGCGDLLHALSYEAEDTNTYKIITAAGLTPEQLRQITPDDSRTTRRRR